MNIIYLLPLFHTLPSCSFFHNSLSTCPNPLHPIQFSMLYWHECNKDNIAKASSHPSLCLWPLPFSQPLSLVQSSFSCFSTIFYNRFCSLSLSLTPRITSPPRSLPPSLSLWPRGPCFAEIQSSLLFKPAVPFHSHFVTLQCTHNTRSFLNAILFCLHKHTHSRKSGHTETLANICKIA